MRNSIYSNRLPTVEERYEYPVSQWEDQRAKYWEYWYHFDGLFTEETISEDSDQLRHPLQLNPFNMACMLHSGFLFGEVDDNSGPLVDAVVEPWNRNSSDERRRDAAKLTDLVNRVWAENGGRSLMQESGVISQVLGGAVFGVFYDPSREEEGKLPIRIDRVLPEYFYPVWASNQYWNLLESIVAYPITRLQAKQMYGVESHVEQPMYQEHWRGNEYQATVDGKQARWRGEPMKGKSLACPSYATPYVYIPHIRVGQFYGTSLLKHKMGMAREINDRTADVGDLISETARRLPMVSNVRKMSVRKLAHGVVLLDAGEHAPGGNEPKIVYPPANSGASSPSVDWASDLMGMARTEAYTPPICYGLDEGSQRSALTLALRMIPLTVHIRQERGFWDTGLEKLDRMILKLAAQHNVWDVTPEMTKHTRIWQEWAPILPRDHDSLVNNLLMSLNSNAISPQTAIERLGEARDSELELNLIKEWLEFQAETEAKAMPNPNDPTQGRKGTSSRGQQANASNPGAPKPSKGE